MIFMTNIIDRTICRINRIEPVKRTLCVLFQEINRKPVSQEKDRSWQFDQSRSIILATKRTEVTNEFFLAKLTNI